MKNLACLILALLALSGFGCSQSLEQNPKFTEKMALVDRINEDLNATNGRLASMDAELQAVSKDVLKLKSSPAMGGADAAMALEARIVALENSLRTANEMIVALEKRLAETAKAAPKTTAAPRPAASEAPAAATAATAVAGDAQTDGIKVVGHTVTAKSSPVKPAVRESAKPRGVYYKIQKGETLATIAAKHNIPLEKLVAANSHLPKDVPLIAGQQLYVPAAAAN